MTQNNIIFDTSDPSGIELLDDLLTDEQNNVLSSNSGVKRPSYAREGTFWLDKSVTPYLYKMFDGTDDVVVGTLNTVTNKFTPSSQQAVDVVINSKAPIATTVTTNTSQTIAGLKNFTTSPTAPTPPKGDASTKLATTEFVKDNAGGGKLIGEIVHSIIPLIDAGLHQFDGATLPSTGIYSAFYDYMKILYDNIPETTYYIPGSDVVLPTFTSNTTAGITVSDSTGATTLYQLFNGTGVSSDKVGHWDSYIVNIKFPIKTFIKSYLIGADSTTNPEYPKEWYLEGSNDSVNWTKIDYRTAQRFTLGQDRTFNVSNPQFFTSYRIRFVDGIEPSGNGELGRLGFSVEEAIEVQTKTRIFTTAEEYVRIKTEYGVCGKFVLTPTGITLPYITGKLHSVNSIADLGNITEEALPNILGKTFMRHDNPVHLDGAFYLGDASEGVTGAVISTTGTQLFNASLSSPTYKDGAKVTEQGVNEFTYIVVASTVKTDIVVDIDEVVADLNGKADTDLSNVTPAQSFKENIISLVIPDYNNGIDISEFNSEDNQYTATKNGIIYAIFKAIESGNGIFVNSIKISAVNSGSDTNSRIMVNAILGKNDKVYAKRILLDGGVNGFMFYPFKGEI